MKKKLLAVLLCVAMVAAVLSGCGSESNQGTTTGSETSGNGEVKSDADSSSYVRKTEEGTLTIGYLDGWQGSFDLAGENYMAVGLVYDTLFSVNPDTNEISCLLAESYEYSDDTHIKIKLKDSAVFSNGDPVTSEDVLFSLKRVLDENLGDVSLVSWIDFDSCTIESDTEFTIATYTPFPAGLYMLASQTCACIVSKNFAETATADDWYNNPVGSGPYKVERNTDGVGTVFSLREDYWNMDNLVTQAKTLEIKYYTSNQTMMLDYESGLLDMCIFANSSEYERVENGELEDTVAELKLVNDGCRVWLPETSEKFKDINVRKAMSLAIDTDAFCDIVWGDIASPAESEFCSAMTYYVSQGKHVYNPEEAKKLMEAAGYSENNKLQLYLIVDTSEESERTATVLQQYWSECYIDLTVDMKDVAILIEGIISGGFDFMLYPGSGVGACYPYELISRATADGGPLEAITNEEFLALREKAITSVDEDACAQAYADIQKWLVGNYYSIPIAEKSTVILHRPYVKSIHTQGDYESFSLRYVEMQ